MKTTLVVLAAGMGSRFGGLKQMEAFGPGGETIIDYSLYDARRAGFDRAVIIIKKAIEKDFREIVGKRIERMMDVDYAFQEFDKLPEGYSTPQGRVKPYGTGHAILCAEPQVHTPFCVVNSDDFYGKESYQLVHDHLVSGTSDYCIAGYRLGNTLTENGTVNRGICQVENGYLTDIKETMDIDRNSGFALDTIVSMNMWGLGTDIFEYLKVGMKEYLDGMQNPLKDEFYLPVYIDTMIKRGQAKCRVAETDAKWFGVTYREDAPALRAAIERMIADGTYPG